MGEARKVMDKATEAFFVKKDLKAAAKFYAEDAVGVTPEGRELKGRDEIVAFVQGFVDGFPDAKYDSLYTHESGNVAIDEGRFVGTNTAPLPMPDGGTIPATGKRVDVRGCDIATVENGLITRHHFYFDQMDFMGQLGLLPAMPS